MSTEVRQLDTSELTQRVQGMYEEVALEPSASFHFETGRPLADRLGYPPTSTAFPRPRSTCSPASATSSTSPRSHPARPCTTSAAAPGWTASSPHLRPARKGACSAST